MRISLREREPGNVTCLRQERAWILRVESSLDCVTAGRDVEFELLTCGNPELQLDDVEAGDLLRDRVLDLNPAVQLEKVDVGTGHEEFGGAGAHVADRLREGNGSGCDLRPYVRIESGGGRLLDQLLVAPLDRAVATAEHGDATGVPEQLRFDMTRAFEIALTEDRVVAKRALGFASRCSQRGFELRRRPDDAHPTATASGGGLDDEGETYLGRRSLRQRGDTGVARDLLRREFVSTEAQRGPRRADPDDAGRVNRLGKRWILREEAVARVDGVGSSRSSSPNVLRGVEIRADLNRLTRRPRVQRSRVVRGDDRNGLDSQSCTCAKHPHSDLASVGDEYPLEGHCRGRMRVCTAFLRCVSSPRCVCSPRSSSRW